MDAYQEDLPELLEKYLRTGLCKERKVMGQMEHVPATQADRNFSTRHVSNADGLSGRDNPGSKAVIDAVDLGLIVRVEDPSLSSFLRLTL